MSPELFIQALQHPENLSSDDMAPLEDVMRAYPCFAAAKELYLKLLHQSKDLSYEACLFKTSLASPHRQQLFAYIHGLETNPEKELATETDASLQAFDLIDSFLGDDAVDADPETPDQAMESLQKLYASYQLEEQEDAAPKQDVAFASPLIQAFMDHPQEEISPVQESVAQVAEPEEFSSENSLETFYESAWESLPTDSLTLTLVKIYLKQKKYQRALEILKTLALNNPEKSVYFADQIRFLEKLLTHLKK
ncbi:MAG: hypothetical protein II277_00845 [Bacteroidales bacterium]|nr:hypothetical protein [Bacteroidales bacterium]MBQ5604874.1 hypothetical protein [Bacteroidales bacterium]